MANSARVKDLLLKAGFPHGTINLFIAQVMFETGGNFESRVAKEDNNLSGIVFINKSYQKNATKGRAKPGGEIAGNYAHFASLEDWARDYYRILTLNKGLGRPIDATNTTDLVARLKQNFYFEGNQTNYLAGVNKYYSQLTA